MQTGYNVKKPRFRPLEALKAAWWRWWHKSPWEGRKALHGNYPVCNWYPPAMPPEIKKCGADGISTTRIKHDCIVTQSAEIVKED